ncbi:MAG: calcium-binding protein, partial [Betaproteobacteria bacterium]
IAYQLSIYHDNYGYGVEQLRFSDGVTWTHDDIKARVITNGTVGNDNISGISNYTNRMYGLDGNDSLTGGALVDMLDGGKGNDTLNGGAGNDTYVFGRGYGVDTVAENDATAGNTDVLRMNTGINYDQLWFKQSGNNLEVSVIGTTDKTVISNWFLGNQYHVEQIKTVDGNHTLLDSRVQNLVSAMASMTPPPAGQTVLTLAQQTTLAPVLAANWQ